MMRHPKSASRRQKWELDMPRQFKLIDLNDGEETELDSDTKLEALEEALELKGLRVVEVTPEEQVAP